MSLRVRERRRRRACAGTRRGRRDRGCATSEPCSPATRREETRFSTTPNPRCATRKQIAARQETVCPAYFRTGASSNTCMRSLLESRPSVPVRTFHTQITPSAPADARYSPSGLNFSAHTAFLQVKRPREATCAREAPGRCGARSALERICRRRSL